MTEASKVGSSAAGNGPPHRPRLAFRLGVTGARYLEESGLEALRKKVDFVLNSVREDVLRLASEAGVAAFYAGVDPHHPSPLLRFVSPLARGSDRLAAEAALKTGYELYVPMPFALDEYKKDFKGAEKPSERPLTAEADVAQFDQLFMHAGASLALDGGRHEQDRAYEAVGRFVVRHSDLIIAIWDGEPVGGRGGTADIVEYALSNGVPVWWIPTAPERTPVLLADIEDLRDPRAEAGDAPGDVLRAFVERHIRPPAPARRDRHGLISWLARLGQKRLVSPLAEFYAEDASPPWWWTRAYGWMMYVASACKLPWTDLPCPDDPVAKYWFDLYKPTDLRAGEYAARYRSAYVWLFFLATLTLIFGATAAVTHSESVWLALIAAIAMVLEGVTLLITYVVVHAAIRGDWHERFIEYRLLAELCRKQQVLAPLGRAVSLGAVRRMLLREVGNATQKAVAQSHSKKAKAAIEISDHSAWVAWLFAALERAAPLPSGNIAADLEPFVKRQLLDELIGEQLRYHRGREKMSGRADEKFFAVGHISFFLVCICVCVKLAAVFHSVNLEAVGGDGFYRFLGWLAIILPAISAAALGIRSYAELQLLVEQSRHMIEELQHAEARITRIRLQRPLAAEDIGTETYAVATLMLQDLEGWSRLFKVKAIEP
jgi:hypothetical protein